MNKKIFFTTICTFITFFLLKAFFSNMLFTNSTYGMPALIKSGQVNNLYIGSSMFRQGIDILTLNEHFGDSSNYILAYNGNQPILEYYQLKHLIDHGVTIEHLYIDMYVYSAWESPSLDDEKLFLEFDFLTKQKIFDIIQKENYVKDWWQLWVSNNNEIIAFWPIYSFILNTQFEDGGALNTTAGADSERLNAQKIPTVTGRMNSIQKEYLDKIIDLAKEHQIQLTFIETPKYESVYSNAGYRNSLKEYTEFLDDREIDYILSPDTFEHNNPENYQDTIHLSSSGKKAYTELLCKQIDLH